MVLLDRKPQKKLPHPAKTLSLSGHGRFIIEFAQVKYMNTLKCWYREEDGQDLTEYTLLLAFVVLISAALLLTNRDAMVTIWGAADNNLSAAKNVIQ